MLNITTRLEYVDHDRGSSQVHVQTSKCFYKVALYRKTASVMGPGVEQDFPRNTVLTLEAQAVVAVLMFEERS